MRRLIPLLLLSACLLGRAHAQDPHFTQAHRLPAWYNPAAAAASTESLRIAVLYRNQWASVTSPFRTEAFFAEKQVKQHGLGFNLVNNHAGSTGLRQLHAGGQWSLTKQAGKNLLSAGLHLGVIQRSFDPSNMTFDEQYSPDQGSAATIPHTENFTATSKLRPDAGLGFLWRYAGDGTERFMPFAGAGAMHLNKPRETYIVEEGTVEPRYTLQAGTGYRISEIVRLASLVQFSKQSVSRELMASVRGQMKLNPTSDIEGMLLIRNADALAFGVSYRWSQYSVGMSYDVNISGITGTPGAAEIMLVYIPEVRIRAKRERKTVEVNSERTADAVIAVHPDVKPQAEEPSPVKAVPVESPTHSELAQFAPNADTPASDSVTSASSTPLSEAIATILPSMENRNEPDPASPLGSDGSTPDLAAILAAYADGTTTATTRRDEQPNPTQQDVQPMQPIAALTITSLNIETITTPEVQRGTERKVRTELPLALEEPLSSTPVESQKPVVLEKNSPVSNHTAQIEFDQWIGFERGSRTVHGFYKLDVIEPALDLLLNDPALNLELSMPAPEGQTIRNGIVKDIFVNKGLEPARIRILPEQRSGTSVTAGQVGAVRVRIVRGQ